MARPPISKAEPICQTHHFDITALEAKVAEPTARNDTLKIECVALTVENASLKASQLKDAVSIQIAGDMLVNTGLVRKVDKAGIAVLDADLSHVKDPASRTMIGVEKDEKKSDLAPEDRRMLRKKGAAGKICMALASLGLTDAIKLRKNGTETEEGGDGDESSSDAESDALADSNHREKTDEAKAVI